MVIENDQIIKKTKYSRRISVFVTVKLLFKTTVCSCFTLCQGQLCYSFG